MDIFLGQFLYLIRWMVKDTLNELFFVTLSILLLLNLWYYFRKLVGLQFQFERLDLCLLYVLFLLILPQQSL